MVPDDGAVTQLSMFAEQEPSSSLPDPWPMLVHWQVSSTPSGGRAQKANIWTLFSPEYTQILQQQCDKYLKKTRDDMVRQGDKPVTQIMGGKMKKSSHLCCEVKEEGGARQGEPAGLKNLNKLTFLRKSASFQLGSF